MPKFYFFLIAMLLNILPACSNLFSDSPSQPPTGGKTFVLPKDANWLQTPFDPNSGSYELIIVNFWASWCGPCQEETPSLLRLLEKQKKIALISVSGDSSTKEMKQFIKLFPQFSGDRVFIAQDIDRRWIQEYGVTGFPETFIYNSKYQLIQKIKGAVDFSSPFFKDLAIAPAHQAK